MYQKKNIVLFYTPTTQNQVFVYFLLVFFSLFSKKLSPKYMPTLFFYSAFLGK